MIEQLLDRLVAYRREIPKLHTELKSRTAELNCQDTDLLGLQDANDLSKTWKREKELMTSRRNQIHEKEKTIRPNFTKAVVNGTRSGSDKNCIQILSEICFNMGCLSKY